MTFEGMVPDIMGLEIEADNEEQAKELLLEKVIDMLTTDHLALWEIKGSPNRKEDF